MKHLRSLHSMNEGGVGRLLWTRDQKNGSIFKMVIALILVSFVALISILINAAQYLSAKKTQLAAKKTASELDTSRYLQAGHVFDGCD